VELRPRIGRRGTAGEAILGHRRLELADAPAAASADDSAPGHQEQHFRLVIEAAPNAMIMVDARGAIVLINSQAEKLFGYSRQELLGNSVEMLVPERFRGHHHSFRGGYFGKPDTRAMGAGRDLYGLKKDGAVVPLEFGRSPL
jgi:PAS domain S-box-containing protein